MNGRNGTAVKAVVAIAIAVAVTVSGLAFNNTYTGLRRDVDHNHEVTETKADAAVVEVKFDAILRELRQINARLDRMDER